MSFPVERRSALRALPTNKAIKAALICATVVLLLLINSLVTFRSNAPAGWSSTPGYNPVRPPAFISRIPLMVNGSPANQLTWPAVPGAQSYSIYNRDTLLASGLTTPQYTIAPTATDCIFGSYTVTATINGVESIPSAPAHMFYSGAVLNDTSGMTPTTPTNLTASTWYNDTASIVRIDFHNAYYDAYNLYRDGVRIATNLSMFYGIDYTAAPGSTHTYTVTASTIDANGNVYESPQSAPVTITVAAAKAPTVGTLKMYQIVPNDCSVKITVTPFAGAVDYRAYAVATPNIVKYSGGGTTIELNGLPPNQSSSIVVEAVNALGPFQRNENMPGPGVIAPNTTTPYLSINGQGDPVDVPVAIARKTVTFTPKPFVLTGSQAFYDAFHTPAPFTPAPMSQIDPRIVQESIYSGLPYVTEMTNGNWRVRNEMTNAIPQVNFPGFFMDEHFMHVTSSLVGIDHGYMIMIPDGQPNSHPVVGTGQVLHVVTEVDTLSDFTSRWNGVLISPQSDPFLVNNTTQDLNNTSVVIRFIQADGTPTVSLGMADGTGANLYYPSNPNGDLMLSNTAHDLDLRHRFDIYVSATKAQIYVDGVLGYDYDFSSVTHADGTPVQLNWLENQPLNIGHYSTTYHIPYAERLYLARFDGPDGILGLDGRYWLNYRPSSDERHWSNMGHEVVPTFPGP